VRISVASTTARAPGLRHARALALAPAKPAPERRSAVVANLHPAPSFLSERRLRRRNRGGGSEGGVPPSEENRVRLGVPPPSGLGLLASPHGASGRQKNEGWQTRADFLRTRGLTP
jgi:hypothetical protein